MFALRPVGLEFLDSAPVVLRETLKLAAPPVAIFDALAEPSSWNSWFTLMRDARWTSIETACVGAERYVSVHVLGNLEERIVAFERGKRFSFTMLKGTLPAAESMLEDYLLFAENGGTRIEWCLAVAPTLLGKATLPLTRLAMRQIIRSSGPKLEQYAKAKGSA